MFALYLQFSRLDDVIHVPLTAPTLPHPFWLMEEKSAEFVQFSFSLCTRVLPARDCSRLPHCGWTI
jgi:hypothetical protein